MLQALERYLLGGPRSLNRLEVADQAGISLERATVLWRALGFTSTDDEAVVFGDADVQALRLATELADLGLVDPSREAAIARTLGRAYARLAEWQTRLMVEVFGVTPEIDPTQAAQIAELLVPKIGELQDYVWRRHLLHATSRMMLRATAEEGTIRAVGFADIVGYTSLSRRLAEDELETLVDHFESTATTLVSEHGGRVVKTIGDEILYVADSPVDGALIALELVEEHGRDERFPLVRAGAAYGNVLSRYGDVFGSVVNIASRLTTVAKPGTVLVDRELSKALQDHPELSTRPVRRTSVKGYERLEPWRLRRSHATDDDAHDERS